MIKACSMLTLRNIHKTGEEPFIIKFLHKIQALNDNYDQHKIAKKEEEWE